MNELVSIIIPIYNVEEYLNKCIESVVKQSYKNLEIILVNDGSTDNSLTICKEWALIDHRIIIIDKLNGGLSDARNVGIERSKGSIISFVDSDDYIDEYMIEKLYKSMVINNSDVALCNYMFVDISGGILKKDTIVKDEVLSQMDYYYKLIHPMNYYYVTAWNKIYKKEVFSNIRFPIGKINEDEFVIHSIINCCSSIACISDYLYFYVQRPGSIMNNTLSIKKMDGVEAVYDRYIFFQKMKLNYLSNQTLYICYDLFMSCIRRISISKKEEKKMINNFMLKILKELGLNIRSLKLITRYILKYLKLEQVDKILRNIK